MTGTTKFPGALDDGSTLYQPGGGDLVASVDHAALHDNASVATIAAETKVGTGSSTPTSGTVLRGNGTGTSQWAQANLTTDVTGTLPVANGGTGATAASGTGNVVLANTPSLTNPAFSSITNTGTLTLPSSTDTLVGRATTDTLTNKTITSATNSVSAITLTNPYKFSVYSSSGISLTAYTATKVPLNTKNFDTGANFDSTTNYRFTAPVAGYYYISGQANIGVAGLTSGTFALAYLYKNGLEARRSNQMIGNGTGSAIPTLSVSDIFQLNSGDYMELWAETSDSGRSVGSGSNLTYMSGFLVSAT